MSFQIYSIDDPEYLFKILPFFTGGGDLTSQQLSKSLSSINMSVHPRRSRHFLQIWYVLGFFEREKIQGGAYHYRLSKFGQDILTQSNFNKSLAIDVSHWAWYSAWLREPKFEIAWSWLYQAICNTLWENSPEQIQVKKLTAKAVEMAILTYPFEKPALDSASVGSVLKWQAAMEPPFIQKDGDTNTKGPWLSQKRDYCSPELLYLAIQLQYFTKKLPVGTYLLLDTPLIDALCKVCLLRTEQFWPMMEICMLTFNSLTRKETAYGTSVVISELAPFTPPEPRPIIFGSEKK